MIGKTTFEFFSNRLSRVDTFPDIIKNSEFFIHISQFELHVFGVINQYNRIHEELQKGVEGNLSQVRLDIYYLILTWDKIKKIFENIQKRINILLKDITEESESLKNDYRIYRKRIEHLFCEYDDNVRNEYEHPSLKFHKIDNGYMYGNMEVNTSGDIRIHVGDDKYTTVKKIHVDRLDLLRIDFIDLLLKHFSKKILTSELLKIRNDITENIDEYIKRYQECNDDTNIEKSNEILNELISIDLYLSTEGVPLSETIKSKLYSGISMNS
jgi:uncharacterized alkaline shock family protein YloU